MVNATSDRDAALAELQTDLRRRHSALCSFVLWRMGAAFVAFTTNFLGAVYVMRSSFVFGLVLLVLGSAVHVYYVFRMLPLAVEAICYHTGFVCPYCHKPLHPTSMSGDNPLLLQRGQCPSCFQRIEPPFPTI
jgi:hypothetical protein